MYYLCIKFHRAAALWKTIFAARRIPKQAKHLTQVFFCLLSGAYDCRNMALRDVGADCSSPHTNCKWSLTYYFRNIRQMAVLFFVHGKMPLPLAYVKKKLYLCSRNFCGNTHFLDRNSFCYANQKRQIPATAHSCVRKKVPFLLRR